MKTKWQIWTLISIFVTGCGLDHEAAAEQCWDQYEEHCSTAALNRDCGAIGDACEIHTNGCAEREACHESHKNGCELSADHCKQVEAGTCDPKEDSCMIWYCPLEGVNTEPVTEEEVKNLEACMCDLGFEARCTE